MVAFPVPGHTEGSVLYLVDDHLLFTGDSLCWHPAKETHPQTAWYRQLRVVHQNGESVGFLLVAIGRAQVVGAFL